MEYVNPLIICMKNQFLKLLFLLTFAPLLMHAQDTPKQSEFWKNVQFGGGIGAAVGTGFADITLAPSAIYNFNQYVAMGVGLQGSYVKVRDSHDAWIYGGSLLALFNPIEEVQISAELEQVRVNQTLRVTGLEKIKDNFWNTALFLGAGYRTGNVTIGLRYNVLFSEDDRVYGDAFMPFVRAYF